MTVRMVRPLVGFPLALLALAALAVFDTDLGVTTFYLTLLATMFFWVAQSTSWNILSGYSGYFSFGQGAFVGVGVYTAAVLTAKHDWDFMATLPVAAVLSTLLALGIGAVAFRVGSFRGATFALLTLAVPFILLAVARVTRAIDGGQGIVVPVPDRPADLGFQQFQYLVTLAVAVLAVAAAYAIAHSRFGWALAAIRDNEDVAEQVGVATFRWKMAAIATCGFIGGLSGGTWTLQLPYVTVESVFTLMVPLYVIVMSVLGGRTHWLGPVIGAAVIVLLQNRLASGGLDQWRLIIFGGLLAVMVVFAPDGLLARLRARPWPVLVAAVAGLAFVVLDPAGVDQLLDRVVWAMLLVGLVAFWPRQLLPGRWRGDASRPATSPAAAAASSPSPLPPPAAGPGVAASAPADIPSPAGRPDPGTGATLAGQGAAESGADVAAARDDAGGSGAGGGDSAADGGDSAADGGDSGTAAGGHGAPGGREVVVECHGLARHYGGVRALDGLDLRIHEGELVGLVGPNGSGKTTLVNLLSGAVRPTSGTIHIRGRDTAGLAPHTFAHAGIARTYQIPRPFESMTLRDNVAVAVMFGRERHGLAEARRRATGHLEFVGLGDLADARPGDVNLHQRQLLEMARALATSPRVLLLDEALAGLNPAEIDNAVEVVRRIHATGVTIVIIEHLLRVVNQLAQRVVVLDRGRLLADGDPDTVMRHPAVVRAYLGRSGQATETGDPEVTATAGEQAAGEPADPADAAAGEREGTHA